MEYTLIGRRYYVAPDNRGVYWDMLVINDTKEEKDTYHPIVEVRFYNVDSNGFYSAKTMESGRFRTIMYEDIDKDSTHILPKYTYKKISRVILPVIGPQTKAYRAFLRKNKQKSKRIKRRRSKKRA